MKPKHIFWGTLFIILGALILVNNFQSINLDWGSLWKFWPVAIILGGVSIISKDLVLKSIIAGLAALVLAVTVFASVKTFGECTDDNFRIVFDDDEEYDSTNSSDTNFYFFNSKEEIKHAKLSFNAGAGSFNLVSPTDTSIFSAQVSGKDKNYTLISKVEGSNADIEMEMKQSRFNISKNNVKHKVNLSLNNKPEWELYFDIGAAAIDLDLSPYNVQKVDIDMGAASLKIKLGDLNKETKFYVDAGASSIEISVPENVGCEIRTDVSLSSKEFDRFNKINSDLYRTDNFEKAEKKIYLYINSGVSSINVKRYPSGW